MSDQDRVRRLFGDEPLQLAVAGDPLGFDDLACREGSGADGAGCFDLADDPRRELPCWLGFSPMAPWNLVAKMMSSRRPAMASATISSDSP
jgi:hypothetical protein